MHLSDRSTSSAFSGRAGKWFTLITVLVLAINLRHVAAGLGAVLPYAQAEFGLSGGAAGFLVTLPVLCFAALGTVSVRLARVFGIHRTALLSLLLIALGSTIRALTDMPAAFWISTVVALGGSAIGNVLLPPLAKLHFPHRSAAMSSLFVAATVASATAAAALTLPIASWANDWRIGLLVWCVVAAVSIVPWLFMARHDAATPVTQGRTFAFSAVVRSPVAWLLATYFAMQSLHAYTVMGWFPTILIDRGNSEIAASIAFGLSSFIGIPASLLVPRLISLPRGHILMAIGFPLLTASGWLGVLALPTTTPWLWALLLGCGNGAFAWSISLIPLRSRTVEGTASLSGFVQMFGYLIAAIGPLGVGFLHDVSGGWQLSLVALICICIPFLALGPLIMRGPQFEDTLPDAHTVQ